MKETRYTISKEVAKKLQLEGWKLVEEYYNDELNTEVYHLEKEE